MASQTDYLEWHGNQWRVRVKVPVRLLRVFGKTKLVHQLHTASLREANLRKHRYVDDFKAQIAEADKALASDDPITAEALQHRLHAVHGTTPPLALEQRRAKLFGANEEREVTDEELAFLEVATGASTALNQHLDAFADYTSCCRFGGHAVRLA